MKTFKELSELPTFDLQTAKRVTGKEKILRKLNNFIKNGSVHRIKKNLYTCVDFATGSDIANKYQIASNITSDSFVSFHSAFEFYGCYNQMYYDVQVISSKRFPSFVYDGYTYKGYKSSITAQIEMIRGVKVASIERAIVDSINMLGKVMDSEELVKCLDLVNMVDEQRLLEMLSLYDKEILYRKVGYVLSFYKDEFELSDSFFSQCKRKGVLSNKGYLSNEFGLKFVSEWGLYAYDDLKALANKGEDIDA